MGRKIGKGKRASARTSQLESALENRWLHMLSRIQPMKQQRVCNSRGQK